MHSSLIVPPQHLNPLNRHSYCGVDLLVFLGSLLCCMTRCQAGFSCETDSQILLTYTDVLVAAKQEQITTYLTDGVEHLCWYTYLFIYLCIVFFSFFSPPLWSYLSKGLCSRSISLFRCYYIPPCSFERRGFLLAAFPNQPVFLVIELYHLAC